MYLILVYDVGEKKVSNMMKLCREYLQHVQNSVFEGEITQSHYRELVYRIGKIIRFDVDSVIIYELWNNNFKRNIIGVEKRNNNNII